MVTCSDRGRGGHREHEPEAPRPPPRGQGHVQGTELSWPGQQRGP